MELSKGLSRMCDVSDIDHYARRQDHSNPHEKHTDKMVCFKILSSLLAFFKGGWSPSSSACLFLPSGSMASVMSECKTMADGESSNVSSFMVKSGGFGMCVCRFAFLQRNLAQASCNKENTVTMDYL